MHIECIESLGVNNEQFSKSLTNCHNGFWKLVCYMARLKTGWKNRSSSQLEQLATSFLDSFSMKNTVHKQVVGSSTSPSWPKYVDLRYIFDSKLVDNMATIEPLHFHHNEMSQVPIDVPSQSPTIAWKICSASFSPLVFSFPAGTSCCAASRKIPAVWKVGIM